jgi:hypothetical protein
MQVSWDYYRVDWPTVIAISKERGTSSSGSRSPTSPKAAALLDDDDNNNNKLQLGYHPVAVVILHVHKYEISN